MLYVDDKRDCMQRSKMEKVLGKIGLKDKISNKVSYVTSPYPLGGNSK